MYEYFEAFVIDSFKLPPAIDLRPIIEEDHAPISAVSTLCDCTLPEYYN